MAKGKRTRRGNGEGTIFQRKDGKWQGAVTIGKDPDTGKPLRKFFYGKTRPEVVDKIQDAIGQVRSGGYKEPSKLTLGEWLNTWLNEYIKNNLRPTTWESYKTQVDKHIKPAIGHIRLCQLQTSHLQKLYNQKLKGGRADKKEGGLSPRSVRYIHTVIHSCLEQAKKEGMIMINPADAVVLPKQETKEIKALEVEEVKAFLKVAKESKHYPAYLLELATGLRRGELLALRWKDVDLDIGTVTIRQNVVRTKEGLVFQEPKTKLSKRTIEIPEDVIKELKKHKAKQNEYVLKYKPLLGKYDKKDNPDGYQENDLVFCNELGRPYCPRTFTRGFERLLKNAGLEGKVTFHGLRHTFATLSLQEGVDMKTTQENLGHYDPAFTLRVYSGVTRQMKKEATSKIGNLLTSCLS